jgi:hypothetical protein
VSEFLLQGKPGLEAGDRLVDEGREVGVGVFGDDGRDRHGRADDRAGAEPASSNRTVRADMAITVMPDPARPMSSQAARKTPGPGAVTNTYCHAPLSATFRRLMIDSDRFSIDRQIRGRYGWFQFY